MVKIRTAEMNPRQLAWAIARSRGCYYFANQVINQPQTYFFRPAEMEEHGGPIIDQLLIGTRPVGGDRWAAGISMADLMDEVYSGPTRLIAAMRCAVTFHFGDVVEIPQELL
jgi:hypothetical protein